MGARIGSENNPCMCVNLNSETNNTTSQQQMMSKYSEKEILASIKNNFQDPQNEIGDQITTKIGAAWDVGSRDDSMGRPDYPGKNIFRLKTELDEGVSEKK